MDRSLRCGLALLAGVALLTTALAVQAILLETLWWTLLIAGAGLALAGAGLFGLRADVALMLSRRRSEAALYAFGVVGVLVCIGYLGARFPARFDMTEAGLHSLAPQTAAMLKRIERPVHESVELYEQIAAESEQVTVEFHDPTLNPARARMMGVRFAGTSVMTSGERRVQVHGREEADIANGILKVTQGARQQVCFLEGHGEADPFSKESHDHMEGAAGADHNHGMGAKYVLHERHGLAKARASLETLNFTVEALTLTGGAGSLEGCALLVRHYLHRGGNALFMLDPFVESGLEGVVREYGMVLDDTIVIDEASHYWTDVSAPAVTRYNDHPVTRELALTFYPGVRSLSPTGQRIPGIQVTPLVNASRTAYGETDSQQARFDEGVDRAGPLTLMAVATRRPVSADDAAAIPLGPDQPRSEAALRDALASPVRAPSRLAVIGDSDFATNSFFHFLGNGNLFLNAVSYLTARESLIGIEPRTYDRPRLSVTNRQMKGTFVLSMALVPGLLALLGTAVWWRQR